MSEVISLERIAHEARTAAKTYTNVDEACPYNFYSDAGRAFKRVFQQERLAMTMPQAQRPSTAKKAGQA